MTEPQPPAPLDPAGLLAAVRRRTQARLLVGRAGGSYRTATHLQLRADHAAARDAVWAEVDLQRNLGTQLVTDFGLFEVATQATSKQEYLLRPDLGRLLAPASRATLLHRCPQDVDLQIAVGDGLSAVAMATQVPPLLPLLIARANLAGWSVGQAFFVRYCRVGVLNDIGEALRPTVAVLLIGERPGLATAESLSAYLAYRPRAGDTDARRNLISNIHARGVRTDEAAVRILALAEQMRQQQRSGVEVKERLPGSPGETPPEPLP